MAPSLLSASAGAMLLMIDRSLSCVKSTFTSSPS